MKVYWSRRAEPGDVWYCIPSANPELCSSTFEKWQARGYKTAVLVDGDTRAPDNADLIVRVEKYRGYGASVNTIVRLLPEADWLITGGDDTYPDETKTAQEIAAECMAHFKGTWGVMQPVGDPWLNRSIQYYAGSPWMGQEFCRRMNQGIGPYWEEYIHYYDDTELMNRCKRLNIFWQRPDLCQVHDHWTKRQLDRPEYLRKHESRVAESKILFESRAKAGFPGSTPLPRGDVSRLSSGGMVGVPAKSETCIIQLGRVGDLLNVLPIVSYLNATIICKSDYAEMCRGVDGVFVEEYKGNIDDWKGAQAAALQKYRDVRVTQLFPNYPGQTRECPQYCLEEWRMAGMLEMYGQLPLRFNRNLEREAALLAEHRVSPGGEKLLLTSLKGISGPFKRADWFLQELKKTWGGKFRILDLSNVRAKVFYDFLGFYDLAAGLVTIDTSTLHLCWASNVPSVQLLSFEPEDWHGSTQKGNCVFSCKYREVMDKMSDIHAAIERWQ